MADIYNRVKQVERRLSFVMENMRMKAAVSNGVLGPDGKPNFRVFEGSLEELYQASKKADDLFSESDLTPEAVGIDPGVTDPGNGTE